METLEGFPNLPAMVRAEHSSAAPHALDSTAAFLPLPRLDPGPGVHWSSMQVGDRFWAHETAVIDSPATIGDGTRIWHFCHVMAGARIGERCVLGQNVFVASRAVIGDGCKIQNNVSIYDDVVLDDDVFVAPSAVFTNVNIPRAFIER